MYRSILLSLFSLGTRTFSYPTPSNQSLTWNDCPSYVIDAQHADQIRCAYHKVPMDWENLGKGVVTIGIAKLPAQDPQRRIGNLFYNPGGPGGRSSNRLADMLTGIAKIHPEIRHRFDIIGVDIRGTGLSNPIKCDINLYNDIHRRPWHPNDQKSFDELKELNIAFRQSCLNMTGPLIDCMDTKSIIRDHESVRLALGGEPLSYVGNSYGTQLGEQYAEAYPDNIRAMVLDGIASLSPSEISNYVMGASAAESSLKYFFSWCSSQDAKTCPLAHSIGNQTLEQSWMKLVERADREGIPCLGETCTRSTVSANDIRTSAYELLYTPALSFGALAQALHEAYRGNGTAFSYISLPPNTDDASIYTNSESLSNVPVTCQDWRHSEDTYTSVKIKETSGESQFPLMAGLSAIYGFQDQCIGWPKPERNRPHKVDIPRTSKLPTILMVNTMYDPATSYDMAANVRDEIGGDRVSFITRNAGGHTTWIQPGVYDGKSVAAIDKYLLELETPGDAVFYDS